MPLLRTETGWRWRKTLVSMTTTRLRRARGAGWRKMLFHTCELRMKSPIAIYESLRNVGVNEPHKNPKSECRNPKQIRNPKHETGVFRDGARWHPFGFRILNLFRISIFG